MIMYHLCMFLTGSQINKINIWVKRSKVSDTSQWMNAWVNYFWQCSMDKYFPICIHRSVIWDEIFKS